MNAPVEPLGQAVPLFTLPPLRGAAGRPSAVEQVAAIRRDQIIRFGHTPEADRKLPLIHLPKEAEGRVRAVLDDIRWNKLDLAKIHALRAAAILLAFVDRLDADAAEGPSTVI